MQVSAANAVVRHAAQRPAASEPTRAPIVDLTQLAVAQTNVQMTAAAGAALGQATDEFTGVLVYILA